MGNEVIESRGYLRILSRVLLLGVMFFLLSAISAPEARAEGQRWPGTKITYYTDSKAWDWSIKRAVAEWNRSGINTRFVKVDSARGADVIVSARKIIGCQGWANIGYGAAQAVVDLWGGGSVCDKFAMAGVAAHEFGHILGLTHANKGCQLMRETVGEGCPKPPPEKWDCRLIKAPDLKRALALYGGNGAPLRDPEYCYMYPVSKPVSDLTAAPAAIWSDQPIKLKWTNPSSKGFTALKVTRTKDDCPTSHDDPSATTLIKMEAYAPDRGATTSYTDDSLWGETEGTYCYALWAGDTSGRFNPQPRTVLVELMPAPPHDAFANAAPVSALSWTERTAFGESSVEEAETTSCGAPSRTLWYSYTPQVSETVRATASSSSFYGASVAIYEGDSLASLTQLACGTERDRGAVHTLAAGTTYYFQLGDDGTSEWINLRVAAEPSNDAFQDATLINDTPYSKSFPIDLATTETGEPVPSCATPEATVWYRYEASSARAVLMKTSAPEFGAGNPVFGVYSGSTLETLTEVACGTEDLFRFTGTPGETYWLQVGRGDVDDYRKLVGDVTFSIDEVRPPANDDLASATKINDTSFFTSAWLDMSGATREVGEPETCGEHVFGGSRWYRFTPQAAGKMNVWAETENFEDVIVGVYSGSGYANLKRVACGLHNLYDVRVERGTSYYIQVAPAGETYPSVKLHTSGPFRN